MQKATLLVLGFGALALASCGPKAGTGTPGTPPTTTAPLTVSGASFGSGGSVSAGGQAHILSVNFSGQLSGVEGSPSVTFKALGAAGETVLTAPCKLTSTVTLSCDYTVRAEDAGKAVNGIQLDETSVMTGAVKAADGRTLTLNLADISAATGIKSSKFTYRTGPRF